MKEKLGGPKELLEVLAAIESATGSKHLSSVTNSNIENILRLTKGRTFIGAETPLASSFNIGGNPDSVFGFSDLFTKGENGQVYLTDIKTGGKINDILKPQYIAQVGMYATLAKQMHDQFSKNENYSYEDMLNDYGEKYRKITKKDLTKDEFEFLRDSDFSKLILEILGTSDSGEGRSWQANKSILDKLGLDEVSNKLIALGGLDNPEAQRILVEQLVPQLENLKSQFKIEGLVHSGKEVPQEDKEKQNKELEKALKLYKEILKLETEIHRLEKEKGQAAKDLLKSRRAEMNVLKDELNALEVIKSKEYEDQQTTIKREEKYRRAKEREAERKTSERGAKALLKERNRLDIALYKNYNQSRMSMNSSEQAALTEQRVNLEEAKRENEEKLKDYKRYLSSPAGKKLQREMENLRNLGMSNEDVRNKGENTFWGQMKNQFSRLFTNFMRFGMVSRVLQTVRRDIQKVVQAAKELNKAMTNLRIVTGKTADEAKEMINGYAKLANQIGATTTEVATSANEWFNKNVEITLK